ncbi:hypothetical protein AOC05_03870 [Arthrobacter alpinus]|uniref:Uncharacterized protein n=1 Tax=Arthrobacter alpinus TaxID=656366 RepID=A0A0M4QLE5_9MICC|nr:MULTISPECIES: hypothetical protein [Arthrobacter]ALE91672.1 hypothetical protein AOC05_03870 [Arthrobacter alpinus]
MISDWALRSCLDRVTALGDAHLDSHTYRAGVLDELRAVVVYDAWVWPLAGPVTTVGMTPMAQVPCAEELPLLISLRYQTHINRWTTLPINPSKAVSLKRVTGNELGRSELWRDRLSRFGVVDVLSVAFAEGWGLWDWLELWRGPGGFDFSDTDAHCVESIAGVVATGLQECTGHEFQSGGTGGAVVGHRQAVLVLADDLFIMSQTDSAGPWLELLQQAPQLHQGVPAEVLNVAAQLLTVEQGIDAHPARSCRHVGAHCRHCPRLPPR